MLKAVRRHFGKIILIALSLLLVGALLPVGQRPRASNVLRDGTQLKQVHLAALSYLDRPGNDEVPATWRVLLDKGMLMPEILVASRRGRLDPARLAAIVDAQDVFDDSQSSHWEQLGDIALSREPGVFQNMRTDLVAGFFLVHSRESRWGAPPYLNVVFADDHVTAYPFRLKGEQTPEFLAMVRADREHREALGLSEPPDYALLVREYHVEKDYR